MARKKNMIEPLATIWRADDALWSLVEQVLAELDPPTRFGRAHRPA